MKFGKYICNGKSYKLGKFYEHYYNVSPKNTHTASGDVKILLDILNKIIKDPLIINKHEKIYNMHVIKYDNCGNDSSIEKINAKYFYGYYMKLNLLGVKRSFVYSFVKKTMYRIADNFSSFNLQFRNIHNTFMLNKKFNVYGSFISEKLIEHNLINEYFISDDCVVFDFIKIDFGGFEKWEEILMFGSLHEQNNKK